MSSNAGGRPLVAALLSALFPGLGQIREGHRRRGWWFVWIGLAFVVPALALLVLVFYVTGLSLALDLARPFFRSPGLLLVLLAANVAVLGFRAVAVMDAFQIASPTRGVPGRGGLGKATNLAALAVILAATALPHVWIGHRNLVLYDLLTHDFTADPGQASTTTLPAPTTTTGTTQPGATTLPTTTTTVAPTTTTTKPDPFAGEDRVNVLLMGSDAGIGRVGVRTDTMIIVSVDPETGWTAMFQVPRNFIKLPIPEGHPARPLWADGAWGDPGNLAWGIYAYGQANPGLFSGPNTGGDAAKVILGNLVGLEIDYFAMVDLQGFADMIDALGGVEITVTRRIYDSSYPQVDGTSVEIEFLPGTYHMDGREALAFARSRQQSDDFDRMGRQRCVLEALARQADPVSLLRELPTLAPVIEHSVITDIPMALIPDFLEVLEKVDTEQIVSMRFMPNAPEFAGTSTSYVAYRIQGYNVPNVDLIRDRVAIATTLSPDEAIAALGLQPLDSACGVAAEEE